VECASQRFHQNILPMVVVFDEEYTNVGHTELETKLVSYQAGRQQAMLPCDGSPTEKSERVE